MDNIVFGPVHGAQRILTVFDDHILLEQVQNFRSFLTNDFLNGDKELFFCDMVTCQFRPGSSLILGYLQFEIYGVSNRGNYGSENSFTFEYTLNSEMEKIYEFIKTKVRNSKNKEASPTQSLYDYESPLDELIKMKNLLEQNVITKEEFDAYKQKIIGNKQEKKDETFSKPEIEEKTAVFVKEYCGMDSNNSTIIVPANSVGKVKRLYIGSCDIVMVDNKGRKRELPYVPRSYLKL